MSIISPLWVLSSIRNVSPIGFIPAWQPAFLSPFLISTCLDHRHILQWFRLAVPIYWLITTQRLQCEHLKPSCCSWRILRAISRSACRWLPRLLRFRFIYFSKRKTSQNGWPLLDSTETSYFKTLLIGFAASHNLPLLGPQLVLGDNSYLYSYVYIISDFQ